MNNMVLKELYKVYKDYNIVVFGRPLNQKTIPFTFLPKDKELMDCEVVEKKIEEKEYIERGVKFATMKPTKPIKRKGTIYVYVK